MPLNLITDPWIPVIDTSGSRRVIAPWEIADPTLERPDWPRADLSVACLELLIGLVFLADPPVNDDDRDNRAAPDPERLRTRLAPFASAFTLTGDGPLFLQDLEPLEGDANPPDMLFIDSAGANTAKNNADLMVRRGRYPVLDPALAAMALYTFQAFAPSGGAGNRTSMRGGGPMVTLVDPGTGLWDLVWANVPCGQPGRLQDLPWMRPTRTSEKDASATLPPPGHDLVPEVFFGMPRRLRLVEGEGGITGVVQRPWGTNYTGWQHPLTPYYRQNVGEEWLPKHPKPGVFGYRHWLGVIANGSGGNTRLAQCLRDRPAGQLGRVLVAGWAMDNMKPLDFVYSAQPWLSLPPVAEPYLEGLIVAAEQAGLALRNALDPLLADSAAREAERETFFIETEAAFLAHIERLQAGQGADAVASSWRDALQRQALDQFHALALDGLAARDVKTIEDLVEARGQLLAVFGGYRSTGRALFAALNMELPAKKGKGA